MQVRTISSFVLTEHTVKIINFPKIYQIKHQMPFQLSFLAGSLNEIMEVSVYFFTHE